MNYQNPASYGRYGDTTLVHMNPQEVAGLNALGAAYGQPMTINPATGYPEAFSLRNLLPTIIGAGLNIASGGMLTPLQAGLITGAGYTVATGDIRKGIGAGFGAAGGAGFGSGLTAAGSAAAPVQGVGTVAENFARAGEGFKALGSSEGLNAFMGTPGTSAVPGTGIGGVGGLAKSTAMSLAPAALEPPKMPEAAPSYIRPYSLDIENTSSTPYGSSAEEEQLRYKFTAKEPYRVAQGGHIRYQEGGPVGGMPAPVSQAASDVYGNIANVQRMAGLQAIDVPTYTPAFDPSTYDVGTGMGMRKFNELRSLGATDQQIRDIAAQAPVVGPRAQERIDLLNNPLGTTSVGYRAQDYGMRLPEPTESEIYKKSDNKIGLFSMGPSDFGGFVNNLQNNMSPPTVIGYTSSGDPIYDRRPRSSSGGGFAEGGVAQLREGRFLRGDGDGMSDEIPASIEGEVDALLSDGEFVIPADVVSHLGNGSSEAGARVLYDMMDRIRKERTGKEEQAKEIPADKVLPV